MMRESSSMVLASTQRIDKSLGAYLGFACGDALGITVEFMQPCAIREQFSVHKEITGGGWLGLKPGAVTDDTEMTLTLGQALVDTQGWDLNAVADQFLFWLNSNPTDIGDTCLRGIRRYKNTGELSGPENEFEAGNGACVRNLPVVLATLYRDDLFEQWSREQNHLTHNNSLSDQATLALGRMVKHLINGDEQGVESEVTQLIQLYPEFTFTPYPGNSTGYIVDTVQTVLHYFFNTDSFEACVVSTVNQGGDANTTGALAGMLAGAKYGVNAIPERWISTLNPTVRLAISQQTTALLELAKLLEPKLT
ncbi:MAG: ADP-ribosyl-[dinitrogen reductase] hydrolase [Gammaproteobacteria bacterium]|nr:ADP-ribosyl-[dinitrogen reductase] hydrolase [Gammaproteobacteria bacterium]